MKLQKEIFSDGEGDAYFKRNSASLAWQRVDKDAAVRSLLPLVRSGWQLAEVGCSTGNRVATLGELSGGRIAGIDPSASAIAEASGIHPEGDFRVGTADKLPWSDGSVDVLIYGFCLYLCDRNDLFRIAAEGDRVLRDGGLLVVVDFLPHHPYRNPYVHLEGIFSYKLDHSRLWSWNPQYIEIARQMYDLKCRYTPADSVYTPDERVGMVMLKKQVKDAYPICNF
ncbi:MAG: class I SAM-dependent methyltransferase [Opitutus sp.]|nr:class I SAM-dependent methyltransferase [Opitutus sp.]MCS6248377.1 class I SAM-dependent methyltransferase [Opitutus sp.]MCS6274293.1 class I SAM-dependent methyltransferase [Opitutus sp.]MCS6278602.1 class I SAM-dependent methyltransferase [Opitutus sp.]